jgi:hypothetical protein
MILSSMYISRGWSNRRRGRDVWCVCFAGERLIHLPLVNQFIADTSIIFIAFQKLLEDVSQPQELYVYSSRYSLSSLSLMN